MKTKQLFLTLTLALFTVFAFAQMAGTAHDFSGETWAGDSGGAGNDGQICIVCHIPHNSASSSGAPLWNRGAVALEGTVTYTPYTSLTFDADDGTIVGTPGTDGVFTPAAYADYLADDGSTDGTGEWLPDGTSILCLTCHDGVGNLDAFGGTNDGADAYAVATGSVKITRAEALRNDGGNEHPFSFTYSSALETQDTGLEDPTSTAVADLLSSGKVQCTSCHDVHNSGNFDSGVGLLVMSNAQSALCTTCHAK